MDKNGKITKYIENANPKNDAKQKRVHVLTTSNLHRKDTLRTRSVQENVDDDGECTNCKHRREGKMTGVQLIRWLLYADDLVLFCKKPCSSSKYFINNEQCMQSFWTNNII